MERLMIYDRAEWHYQGDYPDDLPPQQGGTHIGIFFAWLVNRKLESERLAIEHSAELDAIRSRSMTGREFLASMRDGELADGDMNDDGNAFARAYYDSDTYFQDYAQTLVGELPSLYHVDDSWENYDLMAERIDARYAAWQKQRRPWWRFW
jgi:hypothetical protein